MNAYEWGVAHGSCEEALLARRNLGPDKTQAYWWRVCPRGDWLIWQLRQLPDEDLKTVLPALLRVVQKTVDRVGRGRRTMESMRWIAQAAGVKGTSKWAEEVLLLIVRLGRVGTARDKEQKQQVDDIRAEIPEWIWD